MSSATMEQAIKNNAGVIHCIDYLHLRDLGRATESREDGTVLVDGHVYVVSDEAWTQAHNPIQRQVLSWARSTFGSHPSLGIAIRGNKEMAELISTIMNLPWDDEKIVEECADVAFFLLQICELHGGDLMKAVAEKLEVNKARKWEKADDGSFQHVEETP